jgi:hypothetical protein
MSNLVILPPTKCDCGKPATGHLYGPESPLGCDDCQREFGKDMALAEYASAAHTLHRLGIPIPSIEEVLQ